MSPAHRLMARCMDNRLQLFPTYVTNRIGTVGCAHATHDQSTLIARFVRRRAPGHLLLIGWSFVLTTRSPMRHPAGCRIGRVE